MQDRRPVLVALATVALTLAPMGSAIGQRTSDELYRAYEDCPQDDFDDWQACHDTIDEEMRARERLDEDCWTEVERLSDMISAHSSNTTYSISATEACYDQQMVVEYSVKLIEQYKLCGFPDLAVGYRGTLAIERRLEVSYCGQK